MSRPYIPAELRRAVHGRASGCCEYCLIPETVTFASHEIDHIIALKHGGLTEADNLALSCTLCNKFKGSDLASLDSESGLIIPLYHPRHQNWDEHFKLQSSLILPLTAVGRVTVKLLQFNHPDRLEERHLLVLADIYREYPTR